VFAQSAGVTAMFAPVPRPGRSVFQALFYSRVFGPTRQKAFVNETQFTPVRLFAE